MRIRWVNLDDDDASIDGHDDNVNYDHNEVYSVQVHFYTLTMKTMNQMMTTDEFPTKGLLCQPLIVVLMIITTRYL